jgi:hypothetical protein
MVMISLSMWDAMTGAPPKAITPGEHRLKKLLQQLPAEDYWFTHEPRLIRPDGQTSKPDFVIVHRHLGLVIVEVKDWTHIERGDPHTITTRRFDGETISQDNPLLTAERYAYDLKQRFEQRAELWETYRGRQTLRFPWQVMIVLPFIPEQVITQFEKVGIWPKHVVIGRSSLESLLDFDEAIQQLPWRFRLPAPIPDATLDIIRETLEPALVVATADGKPLGTLTQTQYQLVSAPLYGFKPRQLPLLPEEFVPEESTQNILDPAVQLVRGVAGSGKTLVLVRRVQALARLHPDARLLVLTFNVDIANDLQARIGTFPQVEVLNFHRLCRMALQPYWADPLRAVEWLRRYTAERLREIGITADYAAAEFGWRKEMGLYDGEAYLQADRRGRGKRLDRHQREQLNQLFDAYRQAQMSMRANRQIWFDWDDVPLLTLEALEAHPLQHRYDAVFIDEAQDFAPSWIQACKMLVKHDGDLFLCDDPSQSIFSHYSWAQKGLNVIGHSRVLRVPFRSTRAISRAAHSLIEADEALRSQDERPQPDLDSEALRDGALPTLMTCLDEAAQSQWVESHIHQLMREGIPARQIAILCHNRWHLKRWESWSQRGVYVQHFDRMKGLEFQAVILPHLELAFPTPQDADSVSAMRRKLFTAITRARTHLALTCAGPLPRPLLPLLPFTQHMEIMPHAGD